MEVESRMITIGKTIKFSNEELNVLKAFNLIMLNIAEELDEENGFFIESNDWTNLEIQEVIDFINKLYYEQELELKNLEN